MVRLSLPRKQHPRITLFLCIIRITDTIKDGYDGDGIVVMAVDNLPCELPKESSESFSETLLRFVPGIMNADFTASDFEKIALPAEIKNAVILYQGKLTPSYQYINKYL